MPPARTTPAGRAASASRTGHRRRRRASPPDRARRDPGRTPSAADAAPPTRATAPREAEVIGGLGQQAGRPACETVASFPSAVTVNLTGRPPRCTFKVILLNRGHEPG